MPLIINFLQILLHEKCVKQLCKSASSDAERFCLVFAVMILVKRKGEALAEIRREHLSPEGRPLGGASEVTLEFGRGQTMYRNMPGNLGKMTAGNKIAAITTTVQIRVGESGTRTGTIGEQLSWSYSEASSDLTISGTFQSGIKLIAAVYDTTGRMVGTKILTETGTTKLPAGAKVRLFLVASGFDPVCNAVTVKEQ